MQRRSKNVKFNKIFYQGTWLSLSKSAAAWMSWKYPQALSGENPSLSCPPLSHSLLPHLPETIRAGQEGALSRRGRGDPPASPTSPGETSSDQQAAGEMERGLGDDVEALGWSERWVAGPQAGFTAVVSLVHPLPRGVGPPVGTGYPVRARPAAHRQP